MKIKPLTHKMKNKVREHGPYWEPLLTPYARKDLLLISPMCHLGVDEPYCVWVMPGKDIEVVVEKDGAVEK